jgi:cell division septum initiation protein DivIVA
LKMQGSALTDEKDIYNTLGRITKGLGLPSVDEFFNDPEKPDELLQAENEILTQTVEKLQGMVQQLQNPLAGAETIKAEAKLIEAEGKQELDAATMLKDMKQFQESQAADMKKHNDNVATRLTELELKYGADVPGAVV